MHHLVRCRSLGALIGTPTRSRQRPDDRRTWCQNMVKEQVKTVERQT